MGSRGCDGVDNRKGGPGSGDIMNPDHVGPFMAAAATAAWVPRATSSESGSMSFSRRIFQHLADKHLARRADQQGGQAVKPV
jgi:hypothetical protein